jgi:hypothetical protein
MSQTKAQLLAPIGIITCPGLDVTVGGSSPFQVGSTGIITAVSASFSGDVAVGGTLTYEDVTNIDSVGLITARKGINVTAGVSTFADNINANGNIVGDNATNISGINEITATGAIIVGNIIGAEGELRLKAASGDSNGLKLYQGGSDTSYIINHYSGPLILGTVNTERLRIGTAGQIGFSSTNYGSSGQVLTSGGGSAAPSWATPAGGPIEVIQTLDLATTNTANIISSGWTSANYSKIVVTLQDIGCGNNQAANISMRLYLDGSEVSSGSRYEYSAYGSNDFGGGAFSSLAAESGADYVMLSDAKWTYSLSGDIELWNPGEANGYYGNHRTWSGSVHASGGSDFAKIGYMMGYLKTSNSSVLNGIKIYEQSSGKTFTNGKVTVYGYKRS